MRRQAPRRVILAVGLVAAATTSTVAAAQSWDDARDRLKGLPGVAVSVGTVSADMEKDGVSALVLQTDAELALRLAGIRVLTQAESDAMAASPLLTVVVALRKTSSTTVAPFYHGIARALVMQNARLVNGPPAITKVETWTSPMWIGEFPARDVQATIREILKDRINEFINAWLAVNPKK